MILSCSKGEVYGFSYCKKKRKRGGKGRDMKSGEKRGG